MSCPYSTGWRGFRKVDSTEYTGKTCPTTMTDDTHNFCILIPTFNNAGTVRDVVEKSLKFGPVIVINDGCTDATETELEGLDITIVTHKKNRGKGVALRTGFKKALELGYTHAVALDADGQHFPAEIPKLMNESRLDFDAIVIGVRDMARANVPAKSTLGRRFSNYWVHNATGIQAGDSQSGFRVYPLQHVTRIFCWSRKFTFECEVLIRSIWAGVPVRKAEIEVYYPPANERVSHFDPLWDNVRFTVLYLYMNFRHLLVPLPHRRLVKHKLGFWARMREMAALPKAVTEIKGGPIKRLRALISCLGHESNTPAQLGFAVGVGAFIGTSPWVGIHWILAIYAATRFRLNRVATLVATNVSFGPMTAVWALASVWLGKTMLGQEFNVPNTTDFEALAMTLYSALGAWFLGSLVIGLAVGFALGYPAKWLLKAWRKRNPESEWLGKDADAETAATTDEKAAA
ncbi:DUF2062 domain-containing protein [Planctomycetota bacterium]|nr:DUF2062 domain-containing protein [Planctomycetota bacterium]